MSGDVSGRRIAGGLIDVVVLTGVFFALSAAIGDLDTSGSSISVELRDEGFLLFTALFYAYYFVPEWLAATSLGKALVGLRVERSDGGRASVNRIALRSALRYLDVLPFFYLVGFVTMLATGERRARIGDLVADTRVVAR